MQTQDEMDDDEYYQRMVDYENEIYGLNNGIDQDSDNDSSPDEPVNFVPSEDSDEDVSEKSSPPSSKKIFTPNGSAAQTVHWNGNAPEVEGQVNDDSSNLSDDERDLIYSRLYHSNSALPKATTSHPVNAETAKKSSPRQSNSSNDINDQYRVPSINFTFEIDLDDLPSPPERTNQATDTTSIDEDDEYPV